MLATRAELTPWPGTFQNLRASCETERVDHCPAHAVAKWLGHSPLIAAQHYLHIRDAHFDLITGGAKSGALDVQNAAHLMSKMRRSTRPRHFAHIRTKYQKQLVMKMICEQMQRSAMLRKTKKWALQDSNL